MSEKIEITGVIENILPTKDFPSGFRKRVLVINTGGEYPQKIPVEFTKDKCDALDSLVTGQGVTAYVNLRGNEYQGKYYASIQGWKFEAGNMTGMTAAHSSRHPSKATGWEDVDKKEEEEIPF